MSHPIATGPMACLMYCPHICIAPVNCQVVDLFIVRDRATQLSKGSAFIWYSTRAEADKAMRQLHGVHVLPDATGENKGRSMVVRRARAAGAGKQVRACMLAWFLVLLAWVSCFIGTGCMLCCLACAAPQSYEGLRPTQLLLLLLLPALPSNRKLTSDLSFYYLRCRL